MTFPNPGPATQTTGNVAGGPYGAWSGTITTAQIGPAGVLVPLGAFAALYDGTKYISSGTAVFSDANGVSFGISGQTITASAAGGGVAAADSVNTVSTGTLVFSNLNGVTFGLNGQTLTASVPAVGGAQTGISSIADSAGTQTVGMLSFANSNGLTFGLSTGAATATLTASFSQSVQTQASGAIAGSGFTTTATAGALVVATNNSLGLKLGVPAYLTTSNQSAQTGISGIVVSNTTYVSGTVSFSNANGISFGSSAGQAITASYTVPSISAGVSTGGNTAGNTGTYTGQVVFVGGNNITLSVGTAAGGAQTITVSGANAGGAQTGISSIIVSNTTYTSGAVSFSNVNGISFGSSAGQAITASYTVPVTAGLISGINVSAAGGTSNNLSGLTFSNLNGVSFGLNTGASVGTLTASVAAQSTQTLGLYVTAQSTGGGSSTTLNATVVSITPYGALSAGFNAGYIQLSAPATSSLVGINGISVSTNGSTISVFNNLMSRVDFWPAGAISSAQQQNLSASFRYVQLLYPVSFSRVDVPLLVSLGTAGTTATADIEISSGLVLYSNNASTLSPIAGAFGTTTYSWASNSSNWSNLSGGKNFSFPIGTSLTPGEYWIGFQLSTTNNSSIGLSTTILGNTLSMFFGSTYTGSQIGDFGATYSASQNIIYQGVYTASITATNQTIALSNITATGTAGVQANFPVIFRNY